MSKDLTKLLFRPGELVGYKREVFAKTLSKIPQTFFVINPVLDYKAGATKENIAKYRNILIEFDVGSLKEQQRYIDKLKLPYSAIVYSGNKSLHYHIALDEPFASEREYAALTAALYAVIKNVDPQCKNCNRLARTPNIFREDTQKRQEIIELGDPISLTNDLLPWLKAKKRRWAKADKVMLQVLGLVKPKNKADKALMPNNETRISFSNKKLIEEGVVLNPNKSRHQALTELGLDLLRCGVDLADVELLLRETQDKLGLDRDDVPGIMKWLSTKIFY